MAGDPFSSALDAALAADVEFSTAPAPPEMGVEGEELLGGPPAVVSDKSLDTATGDPAVALPDTRLTDFRCIYRAPTGVSLKKCTRLALPGAKYCMEHVPRAEVELGELAADMKDQAALDLIEHTPAAIATLAEVMNDVSVPPGIRAKASEAILDRVGIRGGIDIRVKEEINVEVTHTIQERLARLGGSSALSASTGAAAAAEADDAIVIEGEVVDE